MEKITNLKNKSIFDFTTDKKLLKKILSEGDYYDLIKDPETTIAESAEWLLSYRIDRIVDFAKLTNNQELYQVLQTEFQDEFPNTFRKNGDAYWYD